MPAKQQDGNDLVAKQEVISKDDTLNGDPVRKIARDDRPVNAAVQMIVIPIDASQPGFNDMRPAAASSTASKKQNLSPAWVTGKPLHFFHWISVETILF
jgi:hypothetical protein